MTIIALDDVRRTRPPPNARRRRFEALGRPFPRISYRPMGWPALVMAVLLHVGVVGLFAFWPHPDPAAGQSEAVSVEIVFALPEEVAEQAAEEPPPEKTVAETVAEPVEETEPPTPIEPVAEEALEIPVNPRPPVKPQENPPPRQAASVTFVPSPEPEPKRSARAAQPRKGNEGTASNHNSAAAISRYTTALQTHLAKNLRYPARARAQRRQGRLEVRLVLGRNGNLINWEIVTPSGQAVLDRETEELVKRAAPFPPFPAGIEANTAGFIVPVRYSLKNM